MKNIRYFVLLPLFLFALLPAFAQVKSMDSMVHKVFSTLQAKDEKAFVALYPNPQQFSRFLRNMMEQTMKSDEMKKLMAQDEKSKNLNIDSLIEAQMTEISKPEMQEKMQQGFGESFRKIIEKGEQKGVKWNEAKLTGFTVDSLSGVENGDAPFQPKGLKEAKGVIDFSVGDSAYQLAYNKVMFIESEGGWFGGEFSQLARKGESLEPDTPVVSPEDSTAMMADSSAVSEPTVKKEKTKTPSSKVKVKTKTPARKTKVKS